MVDLIAIPILVIISIFQTAVVNQLSLLHGTADLMLVTLVAWAIQERVTNAWLWAIIGGTLISFSSATPYFAPLAGYLIVTLLARLLRRRIWQTPILALLLVTFLGTFVMHGVYLGTLLMKGLSFNWRDSLDLITLPSLLLNILLAIPIYAILTNLAEWVYPVELET